MLPTRPPAVAETAATLPERALSRAQRRRNLWVRLIHAGLFIFSIAAAWGLGLALSSGASAHATEFPLLCAALVAAKVVTFELFRLYRVSWRWFGLADAATITVANTSGSVLAALLLGHRAAALPVAALLVIEWLVSEGLLLGSRMLYRVLREAAPRARAPGHRKRVLIYGAGRKGLSLLRQIRANPAAPYDVVGFIDDDPAKRHQMMQMMPVLGDGGELPRLALLHQVREVLVAAGSLTAGERRRIRELTGFAGLPCRFPNRRIAARRASRPRAHGNSRA